MTNHAPRSSSSAPAPVRQSTYTGQARDYDRLTRAFAGFRRTIVEALPLSQGEVVLDVGCGTGLCFPMLLDKIGHHGHIVGVEASPEMLAVARERVTQQGWRNITLVQSPIAEAPIPIAADAALLCAVHDVLRSPLALRKVVESLRPAAWVAAGGGKWASPWMVALNVQVRALHSPYIDSFEGFDRPWSHLEQLLEEVHVQEMAWGTGYVATGRVS
jgi:SAM-dependent methyltransferase